VSWSLSSPSAALWIDSAEGLNTSYGNFEVPTSASDNGSSINRYRRGAPQPILREVRHHFPEWRIAVCAFVKLVVEIRIGEVLRNAAN
jgi:hypothetical protein